MQFVMSGGMKLPAGLNPQQEQAMKIQMQYQIQHFHNQGMTPQQIAQVSIDHGMFFHHWPAHTLFLLASRWAMAQFVLVSPRLALRRHFSDAPCFCCLPR